MNSLFTRQEEVTMTSRLGTVVLRLLAIAFPISLAATASTIDVSYNVTLSISTRLVDIRDAEGNVLPAIPNDLSIEGNLPGPIPPSLGSQPGAVTGSGYFSSVFGATFPAAFTDSSFDGAGNVIVGGVPVGNGPVSLNVGDGLDLVGTASGSIHDLPSGTPVFVSSDVSESGEIGFANKSAVDQYTADVLVSWNFDISGNNFTVPGPDALRTDVGYTLYLGRRTAGTGSNFFYFEDTDHFHGLFPGQTLMLPGTESDMVSIDIGPGQAPIFTVLPFIGGLGGPVDIPDATSAWSPEPGAVGIAGGCLAVLLAICRARREGRCEPHSEPLERNHGSQVYP
jgi:hypothetical protein